jgi:hypothetical protein
VLYLFVRHKFKEGLIMNNSFDFPQCDDSDGFDNRDVSELLNTNSDEKETVSGLLGAMGVDVRMLRGIENAIQDRHDRRNA